MFKIIEAITSRLAIKFKYKQETTFRKADVHILGINAMGELIIRAYEIPGGWKLFKVDEMNDVSVTSTKCYGHKSKYNPNDKAFKKVIKKVA